VARELGFDDPDIGAILLAEDWLEYHLFISRIDIGLSVATFTSTPKGVAWIESPLKSQLSKTSRGF
jgi:hypothetical protein